MSDLPRLLYACFDVVPGPSAVSRRLTEYLKAVDGRFQVVVLSAKTPDHSHIEKYCGARLLRVPVGTGDFIAQVQSFDRAVRRQLESEDYSLVHFFDPFGGYALSEQRGDFGYKLVYDACNFPSVELGYRMPSAAQDRKFIARIKRQELFCLMNADRVIVPSEVTKAYVVSLGVPSDSLRVVGAPVDLSLYDPKVMGRPDATPMKILHLGSQLEYQGLNTLLEALRVALQTVDVHLSVVGPTQGRDAARLKEQVEALKLEGKVELQEPVPHDDIFKIIATADVGAVTLEDTERNRLVGGSLSRLGEYLAGGRPVLVADLPLTRELAPAEAAVFYKPGDANSLADAICKLAADPKRRVAMGAVARGAAQEWDSARAHDAVLATYEQLTGAAISPSGRMDSGEITQLGAKTPVEESDPSEATQLGARPPGLEDSDPNLRAEDSGVRREKTDPNIAASSDSSTDAHASADRPPVMGVLLREDGEPAGTEPAGRASSEPPVIMGLPLGERPSPAPASDVLEAALSAAAELEGDAGDHLAPPDAPPPGTAPTPTPAPVAEPDTSPGAKAPQAAAALAAPPAPPQTAETDTSPGAKAPVALPLEEAEPVATGESALEAPISQESTMENAVPSAPTPQPVHEKEEEDEPLDLPSLAARAVPSAPEPVPTVPDQSPFSVSSAALPMVSGTPLDERTGAQPTVPTAGPGARAHSSGLRPPPPSLPSAPLSATPSPVPWVPPTPVPRASSGLLAGPGALAHAATRPPRIPRTPALGVTSAPPPLPLAAGPSMPPMPLGPAPSAPGNVPGVFTPAPAGEPEEIADDEVEDLSDDPPVSDDEVLEAHDVGAEALDDEESPLLSRVEPWLAQLLYGYCPPSSHFFDRHVPPTTMPGRDTDV